MGWYDADWKFRIPLTVANHSGVAAPEGQITIPKSLGKFWENVQADFDDVVVTAADGVTLLDWAFHGGTPSQANRTATIQIDDYAVSDLYGNDAASASVGAFLYWGNDDDQLASSANNSINITTTPKTVHVEVADPLSSSTAFVVPCKGIEVGQAYNHAEFRKPANETTRIYWDLSGVVMSLARPNQRSRHNEEIAYVKAIIYDEDGANTTSAMTTLNSIAIGPDYVVQMPITAGDHEKRYSIHLTAGLVDEAGGLRITDQRATLHVRNVAIHPAIS